MYGNGFLNLIVVAVMVVMMLVLLPAFLWNHCFYLYTWKILIVPFISDFAHFVESLCFYSLYFLLVLLL